ncbi:MAG TPA: hypothetical protein VFG10_17660 [Saprospiraceae bacterium]|nr:hypothetical protein [Saprospiraceae bacterium]
MSKKSPKKKPDFHVFTKVPDGHEGYRIGSKLGVGFNHNSKESGLTFFLDAMPFPINGRIELVAFKPQTDEE